MQSLGLRERWKLRVLDAIEEFALAALPRGPLRKRLLYHVDRGFDGMLRDRGSEYRQEESPVTVRDGRDRG